MSILIDTEKVLKKHSTAIHDKCTQYTRKRKIFNLIRDIYEKPIVNILNGKKWNISTSRLRNVVNMFTFATSIQH